MSTPKPNPDGAGPHAASLEELTEPEEPLTPEQADRIRGGATIKSDPGDVCKTPTPAGPIPIPYPN